MVQIAKLSADLFANTSRFEAGMKKAGISFKSFEKTVKRGAKASAVALGAVTAALGALGLKQAAVIDETAKLTAALGVNIREFQALVMVASEAGITQEQMGTIITKSQRSITEAARGLETYARSFKTLNLEAVDLIKLKPEEQFKVIAKALNEVDNSTIRTATALEIFGRSGRQVINMLDNFNENLDDAREFNDKFGISLNDIDAAKVEEANDTFERIKKAIGGLGNTLAIVFAPIITHISELFLSSGISAETFGDSVKRGMESAGNAIDIVRQAILGLKVIMTEFSLSIDLLILNTTTSLFNMLETMKKIPGVQDAAIEGQKKLLILNEAAAMSAEQQLKALEGLNEKALNFLTTNEKIAKIQEEANKRAAERFGSETKGNIDAVTALIEEQTEKEKKLSDIEKERIKNGKELATAFTSAFEKAITGGSKFSDILKGLEQDIQNLLLKKLVTEPLGDFFTDIFSGGSSNSSSTSGGGVSGFLGNIFSFLPSFDVGTNKVPRDMIAKIHKDEMIVPAFEASQLRNGSKNGGGDVFYNIDARGAAPGVEQAIANILEQINGGAARQSSGQRQAQQFTQQRDSARRFT